MSEPKIKQPLSAWIRHYRRILGMSQEEFARRVGISRASISHYENGKFSPSLAACTRIAAQIGISMDQIQLES